MTLALPCLALPAVQNPLLWALFIAIIVSCSGLRQFLDPDSPNFKLEVGWITNVLKIISGTTGGALWAVWSTEGRAAPEQA